MNNLMKSLMTLHLARLQARMDEAQYVRSPEEAKERCGYLKREIEREEQRIDAAGEPAATDDLSILILAMRECADDYLAGRNPSIALTTLRAHALVLREDM